MTHREERFGRELRRFDLALMMVALNARTQTIRRWTRLSRPKIHETSRSFWSTHDARLRLRPSGPPPTSLALFWGSQGMHREAAAFAGLCGHFGVMPTEPAFDVRCFPELSRGERLCSAYVAYKSAVVKPRISFEHGLLLLTSLVEGINIALSHCPECGSLLLIDRQNTARPRCTYCKR